MSLPEISRSPVLACPDCRKPLTAVELTVPVRVERCGACEGLFFRPNGLTLLLDSSSGAVGKIDPLLAADGGLKSRDEELVFYRKCPVCAEVMNRNNFGGQSGVIVDCCTQHGIWLDKGELQQLATWWHAGGKGIYARHRVNPALSPLTLPAAGILPTIAPPIERSYEAYESSSAFWEFLFEVLGSIEWGDW